DATAPAPGPTRWRPHTGQTAESTSPPNAPATPTRPSTTRTPAESATPTPIPQTHDQSRWAVESRAPGRHSRTLANPPACSREHQTVQSSRPA
ncbi:hypothetical protein ACP3V9_23960, partial [Salmonella enterica]